MAHGQIEAGRALGLKRVQVFRLIILTQALKIIYPAMASQFIMLLLGSSVLSTISASELTGVALPEARRRAHKALESVGLIDKIDAYPARLSGGQQQRVAIARALAMEPDLLLFDEITSALDPELTDEVVQVLAKLAREGRTMILVTHEIGFARTCASRVVFMHQGRIHETGPAAETLARPQTDALRQFLSMLDHA